LPLSENALSCLTPDSASRAPTAGPPMVFEQRKRRGQCGALRFESRKLLGAIALLARNDAITSTLAVSTVFADGRTPVCPVHGHSTAALAMATSMFTTGFSHM
jgi:hypothetical protein